MKKIDFLDWLHDRYKLDKRFETKYSYYGPNVPSNCIQVRWRETQNYNKDAHFNMQFCEGWLFPHVQFDVDDTNMKEAEEIFEQWKKVEE